MRSNDQIDKNRNLTDRHFNANIVSVKKCFVVLLRVINFIMESCPCPYQLTEKVT